MRISPTYSDQALTAAVAGSHSCRGVLQHASRTALKGHSSRLGIDVEHLRAAPARLDLSARPAYEDRSSVTPAAQDRLEPRA